jgi:tetratricopeptide (TPR) repeat protein
VQPDKVQGHYFLCVTLYFQGEQLAGKDDRAARERFEQAAASGAEAVRLKPDHGLALLYRGLSLVRLGKKAEALECLRQAVRCRPEMADTHLHMGQLLLDQGNRAEGLDHLRQAVQLAGKGDRRAEKALETATKP